MYCGYQIAFTAQQFYIKYKMNKEYLSSLPDEMLVVVSSNEKIQWEEEGHEFYLNGTLHDVVKTKTIEGVDYYYAVNDEQENSLLENNRNYFGNQPLNNQSKKTLIVLEKIKQLYCEIQLLDHFRYHQLYILQPMNTDDVFIQHAFHEVIIPPPKTA